MELIKTVYKAAYKVLHTAGSKENISSAWEKNILEIDRIYRILTNWLNDIIDFCNWLKDKITNLEKRVDDLEDRVDDIDKKVDDLDSNLLNHIGKIGINEHGLVTSTEAGFMSPADFSKLAKLATGGNGSTVLIGVQNLIFPFNTLTAPVPSGYSESQCTFFWIIPEGSVPGPAGSSLYQFGRTVSVPRDIGYMAGIYIVVGNK